MTFLSKARLTGTRMALLLLSAGSLVQIPHARAFAAASSSAAAAAIAITAPLQLSASTVAPGGTLQARFTLQNQGGASVSLSGIDIAARTPSGGNADFGGLWNVTLAAGQSITVQKSRTFSTSDPTGTWTIFACYQTTDGVWHFQAPQLSFTLGSGTTPPPTSTAVPPTATSVPPTSTPVPPTSTPVPGPPASGGAIALGAMIHDNNQWVDSSGSLINWYANLTGRMPAIVSVGTDWVHYAAFSNYAGILDAIRARGAMPEFTWMPDDYNHGAYQPAYADRAIANGAYDTYIRQFASDAKAWGHPFMLRFAHEMNGNWYSWGVSSGNPNGNNAADYVAMWRHVHDIFTSVGATNVRWVWCPNIGGSPPLTQLYPGDGYVDYLALDGYNWGSNPGHYWQSFTQLFGSSYAEITALSAKPLIIAEVGSVEQGGNKADWITQAFLTAIPQSFPRIRAVIWFDWNDAYDWRVNSSSSALAAYKNVVASPLWQGQISG